MFVCCFYFGRKTFSDHRTKAKQLPRTGFDPTQLDDCWAATLEPGDIIPMDCHAIQGFSSPPCFSGTENPNGIGDCIPSIFDTVLHPTRSSPSNIAL